MNIISNLPQKSEEGNVLLFTNVSVPTSAWSAVSGGTEYQATVTMAGVTSSHFPVVVFDNDDVESYGLYGAESSTNAVIIHAETLPLTTITIVSAQFTSGAANIGQITGLIKTVAGTIDTNSTSVALSYSGTFINAYATMGGYIVSLDITVTASLVTFITAEPPDATVICHVIYI